jgi:hypothetical protein
MDDWEWLRADWPEVVSQIVLFIVLFLGGPWIVRWLLREDEQRKKNLRSPRLATRRSRRGGRKQTPNGEF